MWRFLVLLLALGFPVAVAASFFGWGLESDATARARNVRQGSLRGRSFYGGGPGFGK